MTIPAQTYVTHQQIYLERIMAVDDPAISTIMMMDSSYSWIQACFCMSIEELRNGMGDDVMARGE